MIESVVYLYKKSQWLVFGQFQGTAGLGELPGSGFGSKEPLGWFTVLGRFLGTDGTARDSLVQFKRFFPAISRFCGSELVANGSGSGTVSSGLGPVRFRVTRSMAITSCTHAIVSYKFLCCNRCGQVSCLAMDHINQPHKAIILVGSRLALPGNRSEFGFDTIMT